MQNTEHAYKYYLRSLIAERRNLSLRALARSGGLSPSHLSRILSGSKGLSVSGASKLARGLKLSALQTRRLLQLVAAAHLPAAFDNENIGPRKPPAKLMSESEFRVLSEWHHMAILSLSQVRGFRAEPQYIADRLGISVPTAQLALDRLRRLGFIKGEGLAITVTANVSTDDDESSAAVRNNHRENIRRALTALSNQRVEEREFQNLSVALRKHHFPGLKQAIRDFVDHIDRKFDAPVGEADEVYQLNIQLFKSTKGEK